MPVGRFAAKVAGGGTSTLRGIGRRYRRAVASARPSRAMWLLIRHRARLAVALDKEVYWL